MKRRKHEVARMARSCLTTRLPVEFIRDPEVFGQPPREQEAENPSKDPFRKTIMDVNASSQPETPQESQSGGRSLPPKLYMVLALAPILVAIATLVGLLIYHSKP